jgi:hypothetical protein
MFIYLDRRNNIMEATAGQAISTKSPPLAPLLRAESKEIPEWFSFKGPVVTHVNALHALAALLVLF